MLHEVDADDADDADVDADADSDADAELSVSGGKQTLRFRVEAQACLQSELQHFSC